MSRFALILLFSFLLTHVSAQSFLGDYSSHASEGKSVRVFAGNSSVRFTFYAADVLRVDYLPTTATHPDSSFVVIQDTSGAVMPTLSSNDSSLTIQSGAITITVKKFPARISYADASGRTVLAEPDDGGLAIQSASRWAVFTLAGDDHLYGTGERGIPLDKRGHFFDSYNTQIGGYHSALPTMNLNVPFVASTKGYALYFDNTYRGRFDLGASNGNKFFYVATGGEMTYYVIVAQRVQDQLEKYTWLTGRQPLPPKWAFGYLQSKYGYRNELEARTMVQTMRAKQIPCDAIVLDLYWFNHMGDISWNLSAFPNPFQMMADFRSAGVKTIVITEPYVVSYSGSYPVASALGYLGKNSAGQTYALNNWWSCNCVAGLLDLTNPDARSWWWNKHPAFFGSALAGIWTDLGEPERHPDDMLHMLGPTAKIQNIYNLLWSESIFNGFNAFRPNARLFNLSRSGFAGSQRYGVIPWSGDVGRSFGGLAVQVPIMLSMGLSGFGYQNSDIGGFTAGFTTPELYVRWMQFGTFCPITRAHGAGPSVGGQDTEPWAFSAQAEAISKKYIELRYRLLPYIYSMAYKNYATGLPLARPLFFDFPADPLLANESSSYLWGDGMLVAPVVAGGATSKSLYLPRATWVNFWNDEQIVGGRMVTVPAPLETLPLFVRAGSIIPIQAVMNYVDERPLDTLFLAMYPSDGEASEFQLYEDDGETRAYQSGSFATTRIELSAAPESVDSRLAIAINSTEGNYAGKLARRVYLSELHHAFSSAGSVTKNGMSIPARFSYDDLRRNGDGYYHDASKRILYIHTPASVDRSYELIARHVRLTGAHEQQNVHTQEFHLEQNRPNPFNPSTRIEFTIAKRVEVSLDIYDVLGRHVTTLIREVKRPGRYSFDWDASDVPSGVYFYQLRAGGFFQTKKLIVVR